MPSTTDVVTVRGLRKSYGERVVVDGLDLDVQAGEVVGLIGANGAGKTTTVECIQGLRRPDSGTVATLRPEVVLMDIRMPRVDGVTATERLRRDTDSPPVLVLTTFDDDEVLAGALRAGASGFLLKGVPAEDLQHAVRTVAEGGAWLDPAVTGRVLSTYRAAPAPRATAPLQVLTAREREVLALIGAGFTNAEIAARLVLGEGTVKTHVNHLFAKLGLRDRAAAVVLAFDSGLVSPRR